ncbi:MAG: ATP-dependent helicase/nuclease subunit [Acidobacteriota bacterium]|nr:ATP-dependent helicase/nuclease subunit [Acidobacteriota bacterium]
MFFLERIAGKFLEQYGNDIHKIAFIFPTRRACIYFMHHLRLKKPTGTAVWAPKVSAIDDFIAGLSQYTVADPLDLVFELYDVYNEHIRNYPKKFEDFYAWGKMIINDFNEIDQHLIDTGELFRTLAEFKEVEDITKDEKSDIYNRYTGFWEDLGVLYQKFNRLLKTKNKAYEGMVYRETVENMERITQTLAWDKVIFCGFNALTRAEEVIISHLLKEGKAEIYWDMDRYFVEDANQEAGFFFRKSIEDLKLTEPEWVEDQLSARKQITLIGVQSKVSQAKVLGLKLQDLQQHATDPEKVAVVLPDEILLFPVLNSLPEWVDKINITIGFPLQQTPVFSLFNSIMEMYLRIYEAGGSAPVKAGETQFYYKDLQNILNHPYIKPMAPKEITDFIAEIKQNNRVYTLEENIHFTSEALQNIFKLRNDSHEIIDYFLDLLNSIRVFFTENKPDIFSVDYEYIYHFYTLLSRLKGSLKNTGLVLDDIRTFRQLFTDIVQHSRIPFTGEPLEGLQIMGMLETQTLDFTHLFVLSVNEGFLPPGKTHQSFIPFDVRVKLGLPTYRERDAIAAYHFYRLLKSSQNITLIYNTEAKGIEKSEKSRFIDQLLIEYAERNKNAVIKHQVIDFTFDAQEVKEISIRKSPKIIEKLAQKSYSPSSMLIYLTCPLQFYFNYILKLREEEEVYESPEYYQVGHIIHKALHELYRPYCGNNKPVGFKEIEEIKERIEAKLKDAYSLELKTGDVHTGRNRIAFEVMKKFLENFFDKEKQEAGFNILMLEQKITGVEFHFSLPGQGIGNGNGSNSGNAGDYRVKLEGTIDRVDIKDNVHRVIDYKTGKINPLNLKALEELGGEGVVNRREAFQLFFYRYLLKRTQGDSGHGPYRLGIYPFKKMYDELKYIKVDKSDMIDEGMVEQFEGILKDIFRRLFNIEEPFVQTREEKNCRYCPYQNICGRDVPRYY